MFILKKKKAVLTVTVELWRPCRRRPRAAQLLLMKSRVKLRRFSLFFFLARVTCERRRRATSRYYE